MNWILQPWPWYVSGPLIAGVMLFLLFLGKRFGVSSNLRTFCTICGAGKVSPFFRIDWKRQRWNLVFILGAAIGGFIANYYISGSSYVAISEDTLAALENLNFETEKIGYLPDRLFSTESLQNPFVLTVLCIGGFLVGFGARYAGGCTSGHAISGLSELQLPSLIAVIGFFVGGLIMVNLIFPILF